MAVNLLKTSKKLMQALNANGCKLTFNVKEFMGVEGKPVKYYSVCAAEWNENRHKYDSRELYSTTSLLRIVFYLRDMWYSLNGWDLPTDQKQWNELREKIKQEDN